MIPDEAKFAGGLICAVFSVLGWLNLEITGLPKKNENKKTI